MLEFSVENRDFEKLKNLNHENSIAGFAQIPKNPREVLKNSSRKRVQPSGYQNPSTHLGDTIGKNTFFCKHLARFFKFFGKSWPTADPVIMSRKEFGMW